MQKLTDIDLNGRRVLIRVDYNVPLQDGLVADDFRIRASLPTINYCLNSGASVVLMSHLGRPDGKIVAEMSLDPIAFYLEEIIGREVMFSNDCISDDAVELSQQMQPGEVHLLENLRFHKGETENDPEFGKALASLADVYVLDAFGVSHRAHASVVGVGNYLPSAAGILMEREMEILGKALDNPERPLLALLGGAKVSDKLLVLENLLSKVDTLLIGGGMAANFIKALGLSVGFFRNPDFSHDFTRYI